MQQQFMQRVNLGSILLVGYMLQACCLPNKLRSSQVYKPSREAMMAMPYVAIQAKVNYRAGEKRYTGHLKIHIHRDHRLWMSIMHSWGGELLRCNLTPAGMEVINRIDRSYQYYDYAHLQVDWELPCSYKLIQAMLLAELPPGAAVSEVLDGSNKVISQTHAGYMCTGTFDRDSQRLIKWSIDGPMRAEPAWKSQHDGHVFYRYRKSCRQALLFSEAEVLGRHFNCTLQYQRVSFSTQPLSFSFNIPQQYAKR